MPHPRHPNQEINEALEHAEGNGWIIELSSGHAWGRMKCHFGQRGGCIASIWSTPRSSVDHARRLRRLVDRCPHAAP